MNTVYNEEESKKARIFQREKRQELQLIIERCNKIDFEYVKVPNERGKQAVFGSSKSRQNYFFAEDKTVNSFMRRCFKENFPDPVSYVKDVNKAEDEQTVNVKEQKLNAIFASKVPRFQEVLAMDASQGYRRKKKVQEVHETVKPIKAAFCSSSPRNLMITRDIIVDDIPSCSYIPYDSNKKFENINYSFGGKILILKAYDIVCSPKNIDSKCSVCECEPKNVYWKSSKTRSVLCRKCYNDKIFNIKNKSRGVVEKFKSLQIVERDFKKKRHCHFYHQHSGTRAAVLLLTPKEFMKRKQKENFLNTYMKY
ncbi:uncharacterized protein [Chironomus tepperi]|uniref:uncharacterized protein n=1 Tax=Chironomus tepperi TaxID=113505 RepID=UPI00391F1893